MRTAVLLAFVASLTVWAAWPDRAARAEEAAKELPPLVHEAIVEASQDDAWSAFTTKKGLEAWMVPHADIDLRVGGLMRTHYQPQGVLGDSATIENRILSLDPKRMLSFQVAKAPATFPFKAAITRVWTVVYFEPVSPSRTKVVVRHLGYGGDDESQKMRAFFEQGNAYTVEKLRQHFMPKSAK